jgi:hypothetical protein
MEGVVKGEGTKDIKIKTTLDNRDERCPFPWPVAEAPSSSLVQEPALVQMTDEAQ